MSRGVWGASKPSPVTTSKFYNAARPTVHLLVEGGFDQRFWRQRAADSCRVEHQGQGGRDAALSCLDRARGHPDAHLLAVLDADLDRALGTLLDHPHVVWTDQCDLEATLLALPALESLLRYWVDPDKLRRWQSQNSMSVRQHLEHLAEVVGRLRLLCRHEPARGLKCRKVTDNGATFPRYEKSFTNKEWTTSPEKLVQAILNFSGQPHASVEDLLEAIESLQVSDRSHILNGHDQIELLRVGLKLAFNNNKTHEDLADQLALKVQDAELEATSMMAAIRAWERQVGIAVIKRP